MARKPEIAELPTRLLMAELGSDKRYKRILVLGGIGVVVLGGIVFVVARAVDASQTAAREAAFGALTTCLLGAGPLKSGETPASRVGDIKLAVVGVPMEKRAKPGAVPWPASCAEHAYEIASRAGDSPLGAAGEALGKALKADANAAADLRAEIDELWAEATAAKLNPVPPPNTPAAPKPAVPLFTAAQWQGLPKLLSGSMTLANVREDPSPFSKVRFLVDQKDLPEGPVLCTVGFADPSIKCVKVPESVARLSPGLRIIGSTDDAAQPYYFAGDRGALGVFPPDGRHAVAAAVTYGASARADGSIAFVARKEGTKEIHLTIHPATGPSMNHMVLPPNEYEWPSQVALAWDWLAYRTAAKQGSSSHLVARHIEGNALRGTNDVGEIEEPGPMDRGEREHPQVSLCKTDDGMAVRVRGQRTDAVSFYTAKRWIPPLKATTHGGAFTCHGNEATSTVVEHTTDRDRDLPTITQSRCNASGCTTTTVEMRTVLAGAIEIAPPDASSSLAADVGGKLLLMWNAGLVGGLRMRFGAAERFKEAEDVVITDGRDEKTNVSSIAQMKVMPANNFAVVLVSTTSGVKVLRVDGAGKVTALPSAL